MTMVVTEPCQGCKDKSCLPVCPTECYHEDATMLYINPEDCIDCGACVPQCPVEAIYYHEQVPEKWKSFVQLNAIQSKLCPPAEPEHQ